MIRIDTCFAMVLLLLAGFTGPLSVAAVPDDKRARIVIQPAASHSLAAIQAIDRLAADPDFQNVEISLVPNEPLDAAMLLKNGSPDVLFTARHGGQLTDDLESLERLRDAGVPVIGMISGVDPRHEAAGARFDPALAAYYRAGGPDNIAAMLTAWLVRRGVVSLAVPEAMEHPDSGFFDIRSGRITENFENYLAQYRRSSVHDLPEDAPRVALALSRNDAVSGDTAYLEEILAAFESRGLAVVPFFNYPAHRDLLKLLQAEDGSARVDAIAALSFKLGVIPDEIVPTLERLDVPVLSGIRLLTQSAQEWRRSRAGVTITERSWQVGNPELAGAVAPTVVASREVMVDERSGLSYVATQAIPHRVARWADRVLKLVTLQRTAAFDRRIALIYYNYPPGRENVGASYLNVLPESISVILDALAAAGYDVRDRPPSRGALQALVQSVAVNPEPPDAAAARRLLADGDPVRLPLSQYRAWFSALPASVQVAVNEKWGPPEQASTLLHEEQDGAKSFVLPALRFGKILLAPQPTRGWDLDLTAAYHDVELPPHHAYLAFYLWLQHQEEVHAMVHIGTHATHEWLPGREVGFAGDDISEILMGSVPQIYPYIVDNVGEGQQAKRRGMAALVSHMTPPISRATLNPELRELEQALGAYSMAVQRGSPIAEARRQEIEQSIRALGLDVDLGLTAQVSLDDAALERVEQHIEAIRERVVPFGLHTFGEAPDQTARSAMAETVADFQEYPSAQAREAFVADIERKLEASAASEWAGLLRAFDGRYVPAGPGHDAIANPASLPTGRNFYGFDPSRLPSRQAWEEGRRLAAALIAEHRANNEDAFPDRLVFNLFSVESNRHEGVQEAQILYLLGTQPQWDPRGRLAGVKLIPRDQLGRPRVDVTVLPSGLYRDVFGAVLKVLDEAVALAADSEEPDNPVARSVGASVALLTEQGVDVTLARRLARVRIFGTPTGAYGPGLETPINAEDSWSAESELADVYFSRMGHLFGQGFWGGRPETDVMPAGQLAMDLFRNALSGADAVIHSRSSNLYGVLDNDDFYQALGGAALAVRAVDGETPPTRVSDLSDPRRSQMLSLEQYLGRELQSRYLNPEWIEKMLDEGYAGARFIRQVADNLWGWQVTVPEAVGAARWQELVEVYIEDRYDLDVLERIETAGNLEAYAAVLQRLDAVVDKGYWMPEQATRDAIAEVRNEVDARLAAAAVAEDAVQSYMQAPGPSPTQTALEGAAGSESSGPRTSVSGRKMETIDAPREAVAGPLSSLVYVLVVSMLLLGFGWYRAGPLVAAGVR